MRAAQARQSSSSRITPGLVHHTSSLFPQVTRTSVPFQGTLEFPRRLIAIQHRRLKHFPVAKCLQNGGWDSGGKTISHVISQWQNRVCPGIPHVCPGSEKHH